MRLAFARPVCFAAGLSLLQIHTAYAARDPVAVRAYVNDACVIADEPYFLPVAVGQDASDPAPKFLPLLGIVVGKLVELFINHAIEMSAGRIKSGAIRKDTRYAVIKEMNLYRADFQPAPAVKINARLGCMTIVAAQFEPDATDCTAGYAPKELARASMSLPQSEWRTSRSDDSIENQLRRANVCVIGKPRAVYEARFEFSDDGTAYRLKDAGYRIDSLLTTEDRRASRSTLYTLKISNPGASEQQEVLSSAWVNLGRVSAGTRANGSGGDSAPWLRVPPMSAEARRIYQQKTKAHQEVMGEIEALKRALTRNQRMLAGLDQRISVSGGDVAEGLMRERTRIAVQDQAQSAELDARNAEYQDLPRSPLEFMPVTIEVAVTETESEKKAQLALAEILGKNSGTVASAVAGAASGLISKSVAPTDVRTAPEPQDIASELARTRAAYFDALVEARTLAPGAVREDSKRRLSALESDYNQARRAADLGPVEQ